MRYRDEGLIIPARWKRTTDEYFGSIDRYGMWLAERWEYSHGALVSMEMLYRDFLLWFEQNGFAGHPGSLPGFSRALGEYRPLYDLGVRFDKKRVGGPNPVSCAIGLCQKRAGSFRLVAQNP